ncbi:hypothetical protein [Flammeovirga sp. SJP92]|uniref:hypothetical protein n=1 Tax=Flammeovirga sp. SJP92 TaxID=1775430 RepID=UPI0007886E29|nr:hypothetical protein [Flammeovirga sp. SJP92]KXX69808.1 hypothetical protein AVL50_13035 [Flammeovirga sp. SJP92]
MIAKVNRVVTIEEINALIDAGADILSFTVSNKIYEDKRIISLESVVKMMKAMDAPKTQFCIHFDYDSSFSVSEQLSITKKLGFNYIEFQVDHFMSEIRDNSLLSEVHYILYGDGIGYDSPWCHYDSLFKLPFKPAFVTLDTESIVTGNWAYLRSEHELGIKQEFTSDVLMETAQEQLKKIDNLVSDSFEIATLKTDLKNVNTNGINLSLSSKSNELLKEEVIIGEQSGYNFTLDEVLEFIKIIKK